MQPYWQHENLNNLRQHQVFSTLIVHKDIHMLFHSNDINFINQELKKFRINKNKKEKFWELWKLCHN